MTDAPIPEAPPVVGVNTVLTTFTDTYEAVTGERLSPRKNDTTTVLYLAGGVGGIVPLLHCMRLYVERFHHHVTAHRVNGTFVDPEYRRLRRGLVGFEQEINALHRRVAKGERGRPPRRRPPRATAVAPGPWWGTAHKGTAWSDVPQDWLDWQIEVTHCPNQRSVLEAENARREQEIRDRRTRDRERSDQLLRDAARDAEGSKARWAAIHEWVAQTDLHRQPGEEAFTWRMRYLTAYRLAHEERAA